LDAFPYLEHIKNITDSESQPPPPPQPQTEIYPGAGAPLSHYIAESCERDTQGSCKTNPRNNPYNPCGMRVEYKFIQCGIKKKGMKSYCDNVLKEGKKVLRVPTFKNGDGVQKLVASMPHDQALGEWELHTLEDMSWNDNNQRSIKYRS
jgi:hypothetical protein